MSNIEVVYENAHYVVKYSNGGLDYFPDQEHNYGVYNKTRDSLEFSCKSLPQALVIAEQFNHILDKEEWKAEKLFNGYEYPSIHEILESVQPDDVSH